jgi:hypothetical protein
MKKFVKITIGIILLLVITADESAKKRLIAQLQTWSANHEKLAPAFAEIAILKEVEPHSKSLQELSKLGLAALNGQVKTLGTEDFFKTAEQAHGGTILSLVEPVRRLVEGAGK